MKSFFKKLSLVLAAAMVITMLPAQSIKAAGNDVVIGPSKELAQASQKFTMEAGSTAKWGFWGASDYAYKTDASSIRFTSSKPAVATVDSTSRVVTAVSAGETIIKFSVTTKSKTWTGEATLTVTAKGVVGNVEAKQYAKDTIYVTFATEDEAKAAKDNTKVQLIKKTSAREFEIPVNSAKFTVKENVLQISQLSWGVTYRVLVNGKKVADVPMTKGTPTLLIVTYEPTAVGSTTTSKTITGTSNTNPTGAPTVTVYDENGIVIEQGESKNVSGLRFTSDSAKSKNASIISNTQGTVQFRAVDAYCYIKATYTFKVDNVNKEITWEGYATAKKYEAPDLGGFVEGIAATKSDKRGKNVSYTGFTAELNAKDERELSYYFVASDGYRYAGYNVYGTAGYTDDSDAKKSIQQLDNGQYKFYFAKEDANATSVSISESGNRTYVKGWKAGTERVYLYRQLGNDRSASDEIMGYIDITVNPESVITYLELDSNAINGFANGYDRTATITAQIRDQYGNKKAGNVVIVDKNGNNYTGTNGIAVANNTDSTNGKSKITVTFANAAGLFTTETTVREFYAKVENTNIQYGFTIACTSIGTPTTSNTGYIINTSDKTIKDSTFIGTTSMANMVVPIKVIKTVDGNRYAAEAFYVASSTTFTGLVAGTKVVVITDSEGNAVNKDATASIGTGAGATYVNTADKASCGGYPGHPFDIVNDDTSNEDGIIGKNILVGTFTATLYEVTASGSRTLDSSSFTVTDGREKIQNINETYALKVSNKVAVVDTDNKIWDNSTTGTPTVTVDSSNATTIAQGKSDVYDEVVDVLYGWYDKNSNGEAVDTTDSSDEVGTLTQLFPTLDVVDDESDLIFSSDYREAYVKYITFTYVTGSGMKEKQTVELNRKFVIRRN